MFDFIDFRFGDIHGYAYLEGFISIVTMLVGCAFVTAIFLGAWTSVQVEYYRRHAYFSHRLQLIDSYIVCIHFIFFGECCLYCIEMHRIILRYPKDWDKEYTIIILHFGIKWEPLEHQGCSNLCQFLFRSRSIWTCTGLLWNRYV